MRSSYGGTDETDDLDQFLLADEEQSKKLDTDSVKEEQPPQLSWQKSFTTSQGTPNFEASEGLSLPS